MKSLTTRSNPTGLVRIHRSRISLVMSESNGVRYFQLARFNTEGLRLTGSLQVIVIARSGNTSIRHNLGALSLFSREPRSLAKLDLSQPFRFRILLHPADDPRLVASAENLIATDSSQGESLLPMQSAELGELVWKLAVFPDDGPVLQFNSEVFPNAAAASSDTSFCSMVLPEALRQIMLEIAENVDVLEDPESQWSEWGEWLDNIGAERPSQREEDDPDSRIQWCEDVVERFTKRFRFATNLRNKLLQEKDHD